MHITTGLLPPYTNPSQPPTKRSPWRQIQDLPFISSTRLILPQSLYNKIYTSLPISTTTTTTTSTTTTSPSPSTSSPSQPPRYHTLNLPLSSILTDPFFTHYIKTPGSNILLLSQGIPGITNKYSLQNGILRLDLSKEDYQRAGLQGTVIKNHGGRKHVREWWRVEFDLRSSSMVRGKKGFDRLLGAAKSEFGGKGDGAGGNGERVVSWVFRDLNGSDGKEKIEDEVIMKYHPQVIDMTPEIRDVNGVLVPGLVSKGHNLSSTTPSPEQLDDYYDVVEWLDLIGLDSPRIHSNDRCDPYISRYSVPDVDDSTRSTNLKVVTWTGLMDRQWLVRLLVEIIKQSRMVNSEDWVSLTVTAHDVEAQGQVDGLSLLMHPALDSGIELSGDLMAVDGAEDNEAADTLPVAMDVEGSELRGGLQRFTCYQFVDA